MSDVDDYINKHDELQKAGLSRVRKIVLSVVPDAQQLISYDIPAFKYNNKPLIYYAVFKDHISIFPTSRPIEELKHELRGFKISKGTIQFSVSNPLPEALLKKIINTRLKAINS